MIRLKRSKQKPNALQLLRNKTTEIAVECNALLYASVVKLESYQTLNLQVLGSNPSGGTKFQQMPPWCQWSAHKTFNLQGGGSNPSGGTNNGLQALVVMQWAFNPQNKVRPLGGPPFFFLGFSQLNKSPP